MSAHLSVIVFNKWKSGTFKRKGVSGEERYDTEGMVSPITLIDNAKGLTQRQERGEHDQTEERKNGKKVNPSSFAVKWWAVSD